MFERLVCGSGYCFYSDQNRKERYFHYLPTSVFVAYYSMCELSRTVTSMKKLFFISVILFFCFSFRTDEKKETVTGVVMHSGVFCGGMELLPEEYAEIATPRP